MTDTLSVRLSAETKKRLDAIARRSRRSRPFLAAEAISRYLEPEQWHSATAVNSKAPAAGRHRRTIT